jgi:hypothetical protein
MARIRVLSSKLSMQVSTNLLRWLTRSPATDRFRAPATRRDDQ